MRFFVFFLAISIVGVFGLTDEDVKKCLVRIFSSKKESFQKKIQEDASLMYLFQEGYCGYYNRIETCNLADGSETAMVISMECDENLIFGLSRLGVSVFFITLSIFIILTIHWKFEPPIGKLFLKTFLDVKGHLQEC